MNPSATEAKKFSYNLVNTMTTDDLGAVSI